jgi:hypothetical protein
MPASITAVLPKYVSTPGLPAVTKASQSAAKN